MKRHIHKIGDGAAFDVEAAPDDSGVVMVSIRWPRDGSVTPKGQCDYLLPIDAVRKLHRYLGDTLQDAALAKNPRTGS